MGDGVVKVAFKGVTGLLASRLTRFLWQVLRDIFGPLFLLFLLFQKAHALVRETEAKAPPLRVLPFRLPP